MSQEPTMREVLDLYSTYPNHSIAIDEMRPIYDRLCSLVERKRNETLVGIWSPGATRQVREFADELAAILGIE